MKIHGIFTEYIELKAYISCRKDVLANTTLYNNYIKPIYGNEEISTLVILDYQNFANDLLQGQNKHQQKSRDRVGQIIDVLVDIYRFAIKSDYYRGTNLPQMLELDFSAKNINAWDREVNEITLAIEIGESFVSLFKNINKIEEIQKIV